MLMNKTKINAPTFKPILLLTLLFVSVLWCIKSAEVLFNIDVGWLGVAPQQLTGLHGIITAPLVHGSYEHLFHNSLPLIILLSALFYGYPNSRWRLLTLVWLASGVGVWLFGRPPVHVGASGITHGVFFYLLVISMFRRDKRSVVLMMIAFFMYGGMVLSIFPREEHISFEYHLFGAIAGVIGAVLWRHKDPKMPEKTYEWENEPEHVEDDIIGDEWKQ